MADVKNRAKSDRKVQVIGLWSECCHTGTRPVGLSHSVKKVPLGGLDNLLRQLVGMVALPLLHGEIFRQFGICPPRGVLIYGPAGCGKTLLANSIAAVIIIDPPICSNNKLGARCCFNFSPVAIFNLGRDWRFRKKP